MEVNNLVKKCDRCYCIYEVIRDDPDWKISYLGKGFDLCPNCYNYLVSTIKETYYNRFMIKEDE